jgi:hypothetical protein
LEQAQQCQTLQSNYDRLLQQLQKKNESLRHSTTNMFVYTHAMLQAQTTVVQPYILKKQALLCHAFHLNEVLTKQIHVRQGQYCDPLIAMLEQCQEHIVHKVWQPRLLQLQGSIDEGKEQVQRWNDRFTQLEQWELQQQQQQQQARQRLSRATTSSSTSLWRKQLQQDYVIIEEEQDDDVKINNHKMEDDMDDDNMSSSTSSSQSTEQASPPHHHHQDAFHHVLSMALAAVSDGRLMVSVFDNQKKINDHHSAINAPTTNTNTNMTCPSTLVKPFHAVWDGLASSSNNDKRVVGIESS